MLSLDDLLNEPMEQPLQAGDMVTFITQPEHGVFHRFVFEITEVNGERVTIVPVGSRTIDPIDQPTTNLVRYTDTRSEAIRRNRTRVRRDIKRVFDINLPFNHS